MAIEEVEAYLTRKQNAAEGPVADDWKTLNDYYTKKLWHQLTVVTRTLVKKPQFVASVSLAEFYDSFISEWELRANPLQLVAICIPIAQSIASKEKVKGIDFLTKIGKVVYKDKVAIARLHTGVIELKLDHKDQNNQIVDLKGIRVLIDSTQKEVDALVGVTEVHAPFYLVSSLYLREIGDFAGYHREALRYLGVEDAGNLSQEQKQVHAVLLGFAALLGENVHNFGELLAHPFLKSLDGTRDCWIVDVLLAFNAGDLPRFFSLETEWGGWDDLEKQKDFLTAKIRLMAVMELALARPNKARSVSFKEIATKCQIPFDEVEFLVMTALSKRLIRGDINQVEQVVHVSWVQPRVLDTQGSIGMQKCLQNSVIVQNILEHTAHDPIEQRKLRLVNKIFNSEYHRWVRKTYRNICINLVESSFDHDNADFVDNLLINGHKLTNLNFSKFCKYLREVSEIKIDKLHAFDLHLLAGRNAKSMLHEEIHLLLKNQNVEELIVGEDICPSGCSECIEHAVRCCVYGPLQLPILLASFTDSHHYKKLVVSELLLNSIADLSVERSGSREECMRVMESIITPNISCSHLVFTISDYPIDYNGDVCQAFPLPREVIDRMCRVWRVKSIALQFEDKYKTTDFKWTSHPYFTKLYLNDSFTNNPKTNGLTFEYAEVHLELCSFACREVLEDPDDEEGAHYHQLIANLRRVFPTNRVFVQACSNYCEVVPFVESSFYTILNFCLKEGDEKNLNVTMRHYLKGPLDAHTYVIPKTFEFSNRRLTAAVLSSSKYYYGKLTMTNFIGSTIRVSDVANNCHIDLEIYISKEKLEQSTKTFCESGECEMDMKSNLEKFYGREVIEADRTVVEQESDEILKGADKEDVALLVVGDPFGATTHADLVLRAKQQNIPVRVIHNASIMNAVGCCGLQLYNFGETVSIVMWTDEWQPESYYDKIALNRQRGMHTLCLLDIKTNEQTVENMMRGRKIFKPARYQKCSEAASQLLTIYERRKGKGEECAYDENTMVVGLARVGWDNQKIVYASMKEMSEMEMGEPLHSLIIPGETHPLEVDMLNTFRP